MGKLFTFISSLEGSNSHGWKLLTCSRIDLITTGFSGETMAPLLQFSLFKIQLILILSKRWEFLTSLPAPRMSCRWQIVLISIKEKMLNLFLNFEWGNLLYFFRWSRLPRQYNDTDFHFNDFFLGIFKKIGPNTMPHKSHGNVLFKITIISIWHFHRKIMKIIPSLAQWGTSVCDYALCLANLRSIFRFYLPFCIEKVPWSDLGQGLDRNPWWRRDRLHRQSLRCYHHWHQWSPNCCLSSGKGARRNNLLWDWQKGLHQSKMNQIWKNIKNSWNYEEGGCEFSLEIPTRM